MPIQLNYTDPDTGLIAGTSYWFAQLMQIDNINNSVTFNLGGYVSLAAKNANKKPIAQKQISAAFSELGLSGSSTLAQMPTALYNFALTYNFPSIAGAGGGVFFNGGSIV